MNYVTELLEEQKELLTEEMRFAEGEELEQTKQRMTDVVDALNKLSIHGVSICTCGTEIHAENKPRLDGMTYCSKCGFKY